MAARFRADNMAVFCGRRSCFVYWSVIVNLWVMVQFDFNAASM